MNFYKILTAGFFFVVAAAGYGVWKYHVGWDEGRANLVQQQEEQARARLAKQTTRQQANDEKAAAADESGKTETVTITQQVIKYIKSDRVVCNFDAERVRLKAAAVDNANKVPGYDKLE